MDDANDLPPRGTSPDGVPPGAIEMTLVPGNHTVLRPPPPLSEEGSLCHHQAALSRAGSNRVRDRPGAGSRQDRDDLVERYPSPLGITLRSVVGAHARVPRTHAQRDEGGGGEGRARNPISSALRSAGLDTREIPCAGCERSAIALRPIDTVVPPRSSITYAPPTAAIPRLGNRPRRLRPRIDAGSPSPAT